MADKKKVQQKSRAVSDVAKKGGERKPKAGSAKALAPADKPKAKVKPALHPKPAPAKSVLPDQEKPAAAPPPPAPPPSAKRKPPSITITRPEATRPPAAQMPPPKFEAPVAAPLILLPKAGQPVSSPTPIFRWMYVGGATRYEVEWSKDARFGRGHSRTLVSLQTAITLDTANELLPGSSYHWRVRGGNDAGWGPWSGIESFRVSEKLV